MANKTHTYTDKTEVKEILDRVADGEGTVFIGETRLKPQVEFVMLFGANLLDVLKKYDLARNDMFVLFAVLAKMGYGNQLAIKQNSIAKELSMAPQNVGRSWRKLKEYGVFIEDKFGNEFVNFDLFLKGKGRVVLDLFEEQAQLSHDVMEAKGIETKRPFQKIVPKEKRVKPTRKPRPLKQTQQPSLPTTEDIPF
ncbi:MAG: hypothetical protein LBE81_09505 [Azonexus sp.]|jgi:DNA-binding MarR family transcriptional regulator|uniref:hypothetical protein n=1 Tax=Azonexus sp. TaxID=1872668 RepID=UPI00281B671C|nr:hypothetical protein [Azonexus sp.]MDR0776856.1 hypothetical protein [Azonexus sp.]